MPLSPDQLRCIPILQGLDVQQLMQLAEVFEERAVAKGEMLFQEGRPAVAFYLLAYGEITLYEGEKVRYTLNPPAPIGELGALGGLSRNTSAVATQRSEVWRLSRDSALDFFTAHREIAFPFYQNLVQLIADKVRRDQTRMEDMRHNIIRTQKAMKHMRDYVLESQDTPISESLHNKLEDLIQHNRRVNYRVRPPNTLPARVRSTGGETFDVTQISRTHISFSVDSGPVPRDDSTWSGVLCLSGPEIPISGTILRNMDHRVDMLLDLLIEDYGAILDGYLTRIQMLDFMV